MTLVVPRIVSDISYVTRISHDSHFAWQAQYLVMLNCHFSWQAQDSVKFDRGKTAAKTLGKRLCKSVSSLIMQSNVCVCALHWCVFVNCTVDCKRSHSGLRRGARLNCGKKDRGKATGQDAVAFWQMCFCLRYRLPFDIMCVGI